MLPATPDPCDPDGPPAPGRIVAAFDFDGTITTLDTLRDFVRFTVGRDRYAAGLVRAAPWFLGALARVCGRGAAKAHFLAATLGGMTRPELESAAQGYAETRLPALVRPEMVARVQEHGRLGHQLVLVSASPTLYLKYWTARAGFDALLATELEFQDDRFSGRLAGLNCWGPEKVRRLRQWLGDEPPCRLYAYGDSRGDREMLALADRPWLRGQGPLSPIEGGGGPGTSGLGVQGSEPPRNPPPPRVGGSAG
jgi:phosphatidylglycerophosphatase C